MSNKETTTNVYISNNKISVLTGSYAKNLLSVRNIYEAPLEEGAILNGTIMNDFAIKDTLTHLWEDNGISKSNIQLVVSANNMTVKLMSLPQFDEKTAVSLIKQEFQDMDDIKDLLVDYTIINPKNEDGSCTILAVLSSKQIIEAYIKIFQEVGIGLASIDIVQNALIKLARIFEYLEHKTYVFFLMDGGTLMQYMFTDNRYIMTRRSRIFSDPSDDSFEQEVSMTINSIIQFHKSEQTGTELTDFFLCGFPAETEYLFDQFAQNFGVKVQSFPLFKETELVFPEDKNPGDYIVPLGGMIRYE